MYSLKTLKKQRVFRPHKSALIQQLIFLTVQETIVENKKWIFTIKENYIRKNIFTNQFLNRPNSQKLY